MDNTDKQHSYTVSWSDENKEYVGTVRTTRTQLAGQFPEESHKRHTKMSVSRIGLGEVELSLSAISTQRFSNGRLICLNHLSGCASFREKRVMATCSNQHQ